MDVLTKQQIVKGPEHWFTGADLCGPRLVTCPLPQPSTAPSTHVSAELSQGLG